MKKTSILIKAVRRVPIIIQFFSVVFLTLFIFIIYKFLICNNSAFRQLYDDHEYWIFILPLLLILFWIYFFKELFCFLIERQYYCKLSSISIMIENTQLYNIAGHIDIQSKKTLNYISDEFILGYDIFIGGGGRGGTGGKIYELKKIKSVLNDNSYSFSFSQELNSEVNYNNFWIKVESNRFGIKFVHYFKIFQTPRTYLGFWQFPSYADKSYISFIQKNHWNKGD